jgi:2-polyprenyl-3-methyl-5-hydroxy-6-metoxy-1,4-benzoquinol methylase
MQYTAMQRLSGRVQDFLADFVRGKDVLDVGCVDHNATLEGTDTWLHKHIARSAKSVVGLDLLESEAAKLRKRGYDIRSGDACVVSLEKTFDVVVAGEIIEHIDNPASFVANMASHLNNQGRLLITTPHAFFFLHFLQSIFSSGERRWNREHVSWYCPFTLENLLRRNGLEVEACYYFTRSRKLRRVLDLLHVPCYGFLASSILVIARKPSMVSDVPALHAELSA